MSGILRKLHAIHTPHQGLTAGRIYETLITPQDGGGYNVTVTSLGGSFCVTIPYSDVTFLELTREDWDKAAGKAEPLPRDLQAEAAIYLRVFGDAPDGLDTAAAHDLAMTLVRQFREG